MLATERLAHHSMTVGIPKFAVMIRLARERMDLSLRGLSRLSGYSVGYLSRVENGHERTYSEQFVGDIAHCLDLPMDKAFQAAGLIPTDMKNFLLKDAQALMLMRIYMARHGLKKQ
jgi:transcriptional regulator with XRE-family HTH domain